MHNQELGDYIGVESCIDFSPDVPDIVPSGGSRTSHSRRIRRCDMAAAAVTEYPPQIPLLARTENLPSYTSWVMKRYRTGDGRLVITKERARRHEYFQVHRSNGRLVLSLIPVDVEEKGCEREEELACLGNVADPGDEISGGGKRNGDPPPEEVYIGVQPCGGFGVAMVGMMPPVHT